MNWRHKDASKSDKIHYGIFWERSLQTEYIYQCFLWLSLALQVFLMLLLKDQILTFTELRAGIFRYSCKAARRLMCEELAVIMWAPWWVKQSTGLNNSQCPSLWYQKVPQSLPEAAQNMCLLRL